jgi:molybdopterin synthase sulfur carrier subunit
MARGIIRYWAAARDAAGVAEESYNARTLAEALAAAGAGARGSGGDRGAQFARVLALSSYLVDGAPAGTRDPAVIELTEGGTVEVLPPFAGG